MFLVIIITLTVSSILAEVLLLLKFKHLRRILLRHGVLGMIFSYMLSWLFGMLFHATGVTVFVAAMVSSVVMAPLYFLAVKLNQKYEDRLKREAEKSTLPSTYSVTTNNQVHVIDRINKYKNYIKKKTCMN